MRAPGAHVLRAGGQRAGGQVAVAATGMAPSDEGRLFRVMLRHSVVLAAVIGLVTLIYAYLLPAWVP
jgi:lactate permease